MIAPKGYREVAALLNEGRTIHQVADELSLSLQQVYTRIDLGRRAGLLKNMAQRRPRPNTLKHMCESSGVEMGGVTDLSRTLTRQELTWLLNETPEKTAVMETVAAIVKDAYAEAHGDE